MASRWRPRLVSMALLALLVALGVGLVLRATPEGLALSDDSIAYIAGARSLLAGQGYREAWLASNGPVTHFPPAYPAVLALLGVLGLDPLRGARFLGATLFGASAALLAVLGWRMTRRPAAGLLLAALFVLNESMLRVYSAALSEPLFIFLGLLAFWMFDLHNERDAHWLWLLACGVLTGWAYLTRYAGLALAGTFLVAILILQADWRRRARLVTVFLLGFLPWAIAWAVRNALVGGTATNRMIAWHPIRREDLQTALRTMTDFLVPVQPWRQEVLRDPRLMLVILALLAGAILVWLFFALKRALGGPVSTSQSVLAWLSGMYLYAYVGSVAAAMTFFDASTKFKLRILAPALVCLLILFIAAAIWAWARRRQLVLLAVAAVLVASVYSQAAAVRDLMKGGQGYASFRWYDSEAMAYLRELPAERMIYTNEPGAVYLYTGKPGYVLPDRVDPVTALERQGFESGVAQVQTDVRQGQAVLVFFSGGDSPAEEAAALSEGLFLAHKSGGAEIYAAQ